MYYVLWYTLDTSVPDLTSNIVTQENQISEPTRTYCLAIYLMLVSTILQSSVVEYQRCL